MKQRKYTAILMILLVLQSSSCLAMMHFIKENLHSTKEWWDNSSWLGGKGLAVGIAGYFVLSEWRNRSYKTHIAKLERQHKKEKAKSASTKNVVVLTTKVLFDKKFKDLKIVSVNEDAIGKCRNSFGENFLAQPFRQVANVLEKVTYSMYGCLPGVVKEGKIDLNEAFKKQIHSVSADQYKAIEKRLLNVECCCHSMEETFLGKNYMGKSFELGLRSRRALARQYISGELTPGSSGEKEKEGGI